MDHGSFTPDVEENTSKMKAIFSVTNYNAASMKTSSYLTLLLLISYSLPVYTQLTSETESKKNFQILVTKFTTTKDLELGGNAEHRILVAVQPDMDGNANWLMPFNGASHGGFSEDQCILENTSGPLASNEVIKPGSEVNIKTLTQTARFDLEAQYWEHDMNPDCSFEGGSFGDAGWSRGRTVKGGSGDPSSWLERSLALDNYANTNEKSGASIKYQTAFRYYYGDDFDTPLDFGILSYFQTKTHTNSTKKLNNWTANGLDITADASLSYTNKYGQRSSDADVIYRFEVPSSGALVNMRAITLQNNLFAPSLILLDANKNILATGDLEVAIIHCLCPGTYYAVVEGYDNIGTRGKFQISISSQPLAGFDPGSITNTGALELCAGTVLPAITGSAASFSTNYTTSDINYSWKYKIGANPVQTSTETSKNFNNNQDLTLGNVPISIYREARYCNLLLGASNVITFTPKNSITQPGSITLWVDDDVNQQENALYNIPPGIDPGSLRSTQINGIDDDGSGDPPYSSGIPGSVKYTWQDSVAGGKWTNRGSACITCTDFDPGILSTTRWYRRLAENGCGTQSSSNILEVRVVGANGYISGKVTSEPGGLGSGVDGVTVTIERDNTGVQGGELVQSVYVTSTNAQGEYEYDGLYYGPGSANFTVTPSKTDPGLGGAVHVFDPAARNVTLSNTNNHKTNQNFQDKSSFTLSGNIYQMFGGIQCPMDSVELLLETNGSIVKTDNTGNYQLNIPSTGNHTITPMFKGHVFNPSTVTLFINQNTTQDFVNTQTYNLSGTYSDGCGNIIGNAKIIITSTDQCIMTEASTNGLGRYSIDLPANIYNLSFDAQSGGLYNELEVENYFNEGIVADLFTADKVIDYKYRPPLTMRISGLPENSCLGYPVLDQLKPYDLTIEVFEGPLDGCPLDTGKIVITDNIGDKGNAPQELIIRNGIAHYKLIPGDPNIVSSTDFLKSLQMVAFDFLQNGEMGTNTVSVDVETIVVGSRARASTFATVSPQVPIMILRDPPGGLSYSYMEQSQTMTTVNRFYALESNTENVWAEVKAGKKFSTGIGFITEVEVTADISGGLQTSQSLLNTEEILTSLTATTRFSTSDDPYVFGEGGDVFVGAAMNISYAAADVIEFDPDNCRIVEDVKLVIASDGYIPQTTYVYTQDHILNAVIPGLQLLANNSPNPDSTTYYQNQIDSWEQLVEMNKDLKKRGISYGTNYSFSGDAGPIEESTISSASGTSSFEFALEIEKEVAFEIGIEVGGAGASGGVMANFRMETGSARETTLTEEVEIGFVLDDEDYVDVFSVDILVDPVYQTPIFETFGSETSCPYEEGSLPIDVPGIIINNPVQAGVNPNNTVPFTLDLYHLGQSTNANTEERKYRLELNSGSNPDGALITIGGIPQGSEEYDILKSTPQPVTVTVEKVAQSTVYSYEGIEFLLYPACYEAASYAAAYGQLASAKLSVFFDHPCSEVSIFEPGDNWLHTQADGNNLAIHIKDYDKSQLSQILVQYKPITQNAWNTGLILASENLNENDPGGSNLGTIVQLPVHSLPDGEYDIRLKLNCTGASVFSNRVRGLIDRTGPSVFGQPTPVDDSFDSTDVDLQVAFTEEINCTAVQAQLKNITTGQTIPITLSCMNNQLIIVPNLILYQEDPAVYEVTVSQILDQYGNKGDTVRWQFTVGELPPLPNIWYVDASAGGGGDGFTWSTAFQDLQEALNKAKTDDQIWIAEGEYYPSLDENGAVATGKTNRFSLIRDVQLIGGFPSSGDPAINDRDVLTYPSIMSGDIQQNTTQSDNVNSIFFINGRSKLSLLDGLTFEEGYASTIPLNDYGSQGGALFLQNTDLTIRNCVFRNNVASRGGAVAIKGVSDVIIYNSLFYNNQAEGILSASLDSYGGAILVVGGKLEVINSTFYQNSGKYGTAPSQGKHKGDHIASLNSNTLAANSIFWNGPGSENDTTQIDWSVNIPQLISNFLSDPEFVDENNFDLRLGPCSPAIDSADQSQWSINYPLDLAGNARINGGLDIGAFEQSGSFEIDADPIISQIYRSNTSLSSRGRVASDGNVTFQALQSISLLPDFKVEQGGILLIKIGGCDE